jgi:hypothetical protein
MIVVHTNNIYSSEPATIANMLYRTKLLCLIMEVASKNAVPVTSAPRVFDEQFSFGLRDQELNADLGLWLMWPQLYSQIFRSVYSQIFSQQNSTPMVIQAMILCDFEVVLPQCWNLLREIVRRAVCWCCGNATSVVYRVLRRVDWETPLLPWKAPRIPSCWERWLRSAEMVTCGLLSC